MALKKTVTSPYNSDCPDGYILPFRIIYNNLTKTAEIQLVKFEKEDTREKFPAKKFLGRANIKMGDSTVVQNYDDDGKIVETEEEATKKIVQSLDIAKFKKPLNDLLTAIYKEIKKYGVQFSDEIVDLSDAEDC